MVQSNQRRRLSIGGKSICTPLDYVRSDHGSVGAHMRHAWQGRNTHTWSPVPRNSNWELPRGWHKQLGAWLGLWYQPMGVWCPILKRTNCTDGWVQRFLYLPSSQPYLPITFPKTSLYVLIHRENKFKSAQIGLSHLSKMDEWDIHREILEDLYMKKDMKLQDVKEHMAKHHDFERSWVYLCQLWRLRS